MRKVALGLGVAVAIATVQCEGTNTGNPPGPLASFTGSDCQVGQGETPVGTSAAALGSGRSGTTPVGTSRQALVQDGGSHGSGLDSDPNDFLWLHCVAWNLREDSTLDMNFWNVSGGCSAEWVGGSARFEGDTLLLRAQGAKGCQTAGCGLCVYDFHFEVRDAPDGDIPVDLGSTDERGQACGALYGESFTLPISTERSGVRCNPIYSVGFKFPACVRHGACGDRVGMPGNEKSCPTCPNGDVCAPIAEGKANQCLKPCTTDADCENSAMGCRNGGCAVISTW